MTEPYDLTDESPVYVISIAAQISGLHDIAQLREVQRLSSQGVNLEGIRRVLALEGEVDRLRRRLSQLESQQRSGALMVWRPDRRH